MNMRSSARAQRGVSMIEVLIAIVVLAVGALGFAGVQMVAMQKSEDANYRSHAMLIAQDAVERMQANVAAFHAGDYLKGKIDPPSSAPNQTCSSECDLAALDKQQLAFAASNSLPDGQIMIADCPFNGLACVAIAWGNDADVSGCMNANGINLADDANCLVMEFSR